MKTWVFTLEMKLKLFLTAVYNQPLLQKGL